MGVVFCYVGGSLALGGRGGLTLYADTSEHPPCHFTLINAMLNDGVCPRWLAQSWVCPHRRTHALGREGERCSPALFLRG